MTHKELHTFLSKMSPVENYFINMSNEERMQSNSLLFQRLFPENRSLSESDAAKSEYGRFMLQYGIKGKDMPGPSPILQSKPERYLIANDVFADSQGVGKWLIIQRHPRYQDFPEHSHSFVEINYVYSGECRNIVNGKMLHMNKGDFLFMAPGCRHYIEQLGKDDLLINFIFMPMYAEIILDKVIPGKSQVADFLVSSMYSVASKSNYVFFETRGNEDLALVSDNLMREYFDQRTQASEALIESRMHELFILLWQHSLREPEKVHYAFMPNSTVALIVNYIRDSCVTCTRESIAKEFSYSPNYISNLLNENIGKSFVQLRSEFRLDRAEKKLLSTDQSVRSVADECGFTNITQFYKLYKKHFGKLPR